MDDLRQEDFFQAFGPVGRHRHTKAFVLKVGGSWRTVAFSVWDGPPKEMWMRLARSYVRRMYPHLAEFPSQAAACEYVKKKFKES